LPEIMATALAATGPAVEQYRRKSSPGGASSCGLLQEQFAMQ
jgi:hypothetical protein